MSSGMNIPLPLIFLMQITLALVPLSVAQDSPQDYVAAHNAAHSQVGVGPIAWDKTVASYASDYANMLASDCTQLVHSGGPYGENLTWASPDLTGTGAVNMWVAEEHNYDYSSNSCLSGTVCGHYIQVVWSDSVWLGCAKAQCVTGSTMVTCVGKKAYNNNDAEAKPFLPPCVIKIDKKK